MIETNKQLIWVVNEILKAKGLCFVTRFEYNELTDSVITTYNLCLTDDGKAIASEKINELPLDSLKLKRPKITENQ